MPIRVCASLCATLAVWVLFPLAFSAQDRGPQEPQRPEVHVRYPATAGGTVRVIVGVRAAFAPEGEVRSGAALAGQREGLRRAQGVVMTRLAGLNARRMHAFDSIPFLSMEVDSMALAALASMPEVATVEEDTVDRHFLSQSTPLIGATTAWSRGFTGSGWSVAILDTGVDKSHPMLAGKVIAEACYSLEGRCPGGVTASTADGSGVPCTFEPDDCRHGTHVAGIAAGRSSTLSGVAPDASIVAMQIFSGDANGAYTYTSDQIKGLERVLALRNQGAAIASVNMSLGGGLFSSACDSGNTARKAAIDNLRSVGIATVIASGNDGSSNAISAPACISTSVSVGSTTKSDGISSFSNSAGILKLLAPGSSIQSAVPGTGYAFFSGTSMATPHVAGAWAVLKQRNPAASVNEVLDALTISGKPITDSRNGLVKPRIDVNAALDVRGGLAEITSPAPGSTFTASSVTFEWSAGTGASAYYLYVGSSFGAYDIYEGAQGTNRARTISNMPMDNRTIYVRLFTMLDGTYHPRDFQFRAGSVTLPRITSPITGSTLPSTTATFSWDEGVGANPSEYYLYVGTTFGSYDIYEGPQGTNRSKTIAGLPADNRPLYVRLWSRINGTYQYRDHAYYAADGRGRITSPAPGALLQGPTVTFTWDAGVGADAYYLYVGTTFGGYDIYEGHQGSSLSRTITGIPVDARTVYVTLLTRINGTYLRRDHFFTTADLRARITSPFHGAVLPGSSATFAWDRGVNVTAYYLYVGTTAGGYELYEGAQGTSQSKTITGLPVDGRTIYVTLWSQIGGVYHKREHTYTAADGRAVLTSPLNGSTLTDAYAILNWSSGTNVTAYYLYVGTQPGGYEIYEGPQGLNRSRTVTNIPTDGGPIYVRLFSQIDGVYRYRDYSFTAASMGPVMARMQSPTPGSQFTSSMVTFNWDAGQNAQGYYIYIGTTPGGHELWWADMGMLRSFTFSEMPVDGRPIHVTLFTRIDGMWRSRSYSYTAANLLAAITSHAAGSALTGSSATFEWSAGSNPQGYYLSIGSTPGGWDVYEGHQGMNRSVTVNGLPTDGRTLYVRLQTKREGVFYARDITLIASGM